MLSTQNKTHIQPGEKLKTPLFVIIISWVLLLLGIFSLLVSAPLLLLGGIGKVGLMFGIGGITMVRGVGLVVVSFGLRNMRRWALFTITALTVLALGTSLYNYFQETTGNAVNFADDGIQTIVVIYLWAISDKFK